MIKINRKEATKLVTVESLPKTYCLIIIDKKETILFNIGDLPYKVCIRDGSDFPYMMYSNDLVEFIGVVKKPDITLSWRE